MLIHWRADKSRLGMAWRAKINQTRRWVIRCWTPIRPDELSGSMKSFKGKFNKLRNIITLPTPRRAKYKLLACSESFHYLLRICFRGFNSFLPPFSLTFSCFPLRSLFPPVRSAEKCSRVLMKFKWEKATGGKSFSRLSSTSMTVNWIAFTVLSLSEIWNLDKPLAEA